MAHAAKRDRTLLGIIRRRVDSFVAERSGVAAVEFAFILPMMLVLYFGCVEVSEAVSVNRKVTSVSSATGDLIAQASDIDDNEMANILDAAEAILAPYPTGPLKIVVSGLRVDDDGTAEVVWSDARNAAERPDGSEVALPDGLKVPGTCLVMSEVDYTYSSAFAGSLIGAIDLDETFYLRPRRNDCVARL